MGLFRAIGLFLRQRIGKITGFFRSTLSKEAVVFMIFVLVSLFFWMLQSLQEINEYELTIPITYEAVPQNVTITNDLPEAFHVTLRDKGTWLYDYYRHRKELTVHLNPMDWYKAEGISYVEMGIIESRIRSKLRPTTQLLSMVPDTMALFFVEKASKALPVILNKDISPYPQHFLIGEPVVYPSIITAYAPQGILDRLTTVETALVKVKGLKKSTTYKVRLIEKEGVHYSTNYVLVSVKAEEFTERTISIPVTGMNFPVDERLLCFPPEVKISYLIGLSSYSKVDEHDFKLAVEYDELLSSSDKVLKPVLIRKPASVQRIRIQPESVECLIEKK